MRSLRTLLGPVNLRRGGCAAVDQAMVGGTNFLTAVLIGRICGSEELGYFSLALTAWYLSLPFLESLITSPFTVYVHRLPERKKNAYAGSTLAHAAVLGLVGALVLLVAAGVLFQVNYRPLSLVCAALAITLPFRLLRQYARRYDYTFLRIARACTFNFVIAILQFSGLALLFFSDRLSAASALLAVGAANGIASVIWLAAERGAFRISQRRAVVDFEKNWKLGRWLAATQFALITSAQSLPWFIAIKLGESSTGRYAACAMLVRLAAPLMAAVQNLLAPRSAEAYARSGLSGLQRVVTKTTVVLTVGHGLFTIVLMAAGAPMTALLFGSDFSGLGTVIALLALSELAHAVSLGSGSGLTVLERSDLFLKSYLTGVVATLAAAIPMITSYGLAGAASAQLAGNAIGAAACILCYRRLTAQPENSLPQAPQRTTTRNLTKRAPSTATALEGETVQPSQQS